MMIIGNPKVEFALDIACASAIATGLVLAMFDGDWSESVWPVNAGVWFWLYYDKCKQYKLLKMYYDDLEHSFSGVIKQLKDEHK